MTVQLQWLNREQTIARQDFTGQWSAPDYIEITHHLYRMIRRKPHTVHVVLNFAHSDAYPVNMLTLMRRLENTLPSNLGLCVTVGMNSYLKALMSVGRASVPGSIPPMHYATTQDEAVRLIQGWRPSERAVLSLLS